ncbi:MAG: flagellar biosynthetic protein FliR [Planctomycetaceae bacterium]
MAPSIEWSIAIAPAAVVARMAAAVAVGAVPLGDFVPFRARAVLAVALAVVALPHAAGAAGAATPLVVASEAVVGAGLGLVAAAVFAAAAWAGGVVGSVAGLSWADEFAPEGDPQSAGLARLAAWLGIAGFFAAGGHLAVVAGLLDSFRALPVGAPLGAVAARVIGAPDVALGLALALAGPALAAVVVFHVAAAVCVRTVRFAPGQGLLQAGAAAVALAIVVAGLPAWLDGFGAAARGRVERSFAAAPAAPS